MYRRYGLPLLGLVIVGLTSAAAGSAETVTYSYDALGRLRTSAVSGGPDNGTNTAICYDAASNRERYRTAVGASASCTPAPYPSPAPLPAPAPTPAP